MAGDFSETAALKYINKMAKKTPGQLGFKMPAEWERHTAVWLSWPYDPDTFTRGVAKGEKIFTEIISALSKSESVELLVRDAKMKARASKYLINKKVDLSKINFHLADYADVWFRDFGPIFAVNRETKQLAMVDWIYNVYGNKWLELLKDDKIPVWLNKLMKLKYFRPRIVMEGGSIDVNGRGTLITTKQCLLNKNRNPQLNKKQIEKYLSDYLGIKHFIWLNNGILADHTDGHIDDIARFVNSATVMYAYEEDKQDGNYKILKNNFEILKNSTDQDGKKLKLIKLPMPKMLDKNGCRYAVSYANFYIGNSVVLVPIFKHKNDKAALKIIQKAFPKRKVVGINCRDLICGGGTIHCVTQQQPAV